MGKPQQLMQLQERLNKQYIEGVSKVRFVSVNNFTKTKGGKIGDILIQRHDQRKFLFIFALGFVSLTTLFVFTLVGVQAHLNYDGRNVKLIEDRTLQIIVTGIFVQFVSLVGIITKSIWNDKPYLDAGMIKDKNG